MSSILFIAALVLAVAIAVWSTTVGVRTLLEDRRERASMVDPGPLDDAGLRRVLGGRGPFRASPILDRVQDAFERLIRERDFAKARAEAEMRS